MSWHVPMPGNTYDAAWAGNSDVVATNDGDGIPNLVWINTQNAATRKLTHVTGAAVAAAPSPGDTSIWFLSLYSRGYDLRRVSLAGSADTVRIALDTRLAPVSMNPPVPEPALDSNAVSGPRPYGLGTRQFRWFPLPAAD